MTPELIAQASEAADILALFNIRLLAAVRAFVADYEASHASVSLQALFAMFIEEKHDRHPSYLGQLRMTLRRMPQLQEKMVPISTTTRLKPSCARYHLARATRS